jgi:hypothetical protein
VPGAGAPFGCLTIGIAIIIINITMHRVSAL